MSNMVAILVKEVVDSRENYLSHLDDLTKKLFEYYLTVLQVKESIRSRELVDGKLSAVELENSDIALLSKLSQPSVDFAKSFADTLNSQYGYLGKCHQHYLYVNSGLDKKVE